MLDSLSRWHDSVGSSVSTTVANLNSRFSEESKKINTLIKESNDLIVKRVKIKPYGEEINDLIVR